MAEHRQRGRTRFAVGVEKSERYSRWSELGSIRARPRIFDLTELRAGRRASIVAILFCSLDRAWHRAASYRRQRLQDAHATCQDSRLVCGPVR